MMLGEEEVGKILDKCPSRAAAGLVIRMETLSGPMLMALPNDFCDLAGLAKWIVHNVAGVECSAVMERAIFLHLYRQLACGP